MVTESGLHTIVSKEPFLKTSFILKMLHTVKIPVFYLDFDLMYSGYVKHGLVEKSDNINIYRPNNSNYVEIIKTVIQNITKKKCLVILDTINGFFSMYGNNEAGRIINAYVSLLTFTAKSTDSIIITACAGTHIDKKWILSPALGRIMHKGSKIDLWRKDVNTIADVFDHSDRLVCSVVY